MAWERLDAVNLWALRITRQPTFETSQTLLDAIGSRPSEDLLLVYFKCRGRAWGSLLIVTGLLAVGLAYLGDQINWSVSRAIGAAGFFVVGLCLGAESDAIWRYYIAKQAGRPGTGRVPEDNDRIARARRLVRADAASAILPVIGGLASSGIVLGWF
jgi:hypothetical protein